MGRTEPDYMKRLKLDEAEIRRRREFFVIGDDDLALLAKHRAWADRHMRDIVSEFYEHLLAHPESRRFLVDEEMVNRLKHTQGRYFVDLFAGRCDADYVRDRLRVGAAHERIGMPPRIYIGAYSLYLRIVLRRLVEDFGPDEALAVYDSLQKLVHFDAAIAIEVYSMAQMDALVRHQAAIRELSTPVILVHERVLLLPLVGTVDSHRAQQIMETVLERVSSHQARVLILDIAGVPVVDTQVADYLLRTTAAVRMLGAKTILTGISPQVARTIVELGVDISTMSTRNRLSAGIELALDMVGQVIVEKDR